MTRSYIKTRTTVKLNRSSQESLEKQEIFDMLCDDASSLSELSSDPEGEDKDQRPTQKPLSKEDHSFSLGFDTNLIRIDTQPLIDKMQDHRREITLKGNYKQLDITCTCVVPSINSSYFDEMNRYEWAMSDYLLPCRSMATYINHFKSKRNAVLNEIIGDESNQPVWLFIKPYYKKGTLADYKLSKRHSSANIEPLYILQMAISLFSALKDAHALDIGLVNLSMDHLWLGMDGALFFDGFKSCLKLQTNNELLPWIDFDLLDCPAAEKKKIKEEGYSAETDVFQASLIILSLMQKHTSRLAKLVVMSENRVEILDDQIDPLYANILPAVEPGLAFNAQDRPTASAMLQCFESMRYRAFA